MQIDLGAELGAQEGGLSTQRLTLYIPNKDNQGRLLADQEKWVTEARELLTRIGGGATAFPPADGTWLDDAGSILWEQTRIVYCFVVPEKLEALLKDLRRFAHDFGRESNQGEVVVEFDGELYRIRNYDPPASREKP